MEQEIEKFVDIFSKLLIGVISFIAPITSYMLSTYIGDRKKILKVLSEKKVQINKILGADIQDAKDKGKNAMEFIAEANTKMVAMRSEVDEKEKLLNYLNPRNRIGELFSWLLMSMALLLISLFTKRNYDSLTKILLAASFLSFIGALYTFRLTAWRLIKAKELLEPEEQEIITDEISEPVFPANEKKY